MSAPEISMLVIVSLFTEAVFEPPAPVRDSMMVMMQRMTDRARYVQPPQRLSAKRPLAKPSREMLAQIA
jgi:hypothetical protein